MSIKETLKKTKLYEIYCFHAKYYKTRNDIKIETDNRLICNQLFNDEFTHFFGYYDKPCFKYDHYISHRVNSNSLSYEQEIDILVDDKVVSSSKAWNWQQGSMSTWLDDKHIIHNDFDGTKYISKIININDLSCKEICFPIYSLSKNGKFALSLNFSRLAKLRKDYGYFNLPFDNLPSDDEDGIYYVDIKNNDYQLYLSLNEIKSYKTKNTMIGAVHKVNHIDISPNSDKAIFLHRWYKDGVKYTRLLCVELSSKKLIELANNDMVSHMAWVNNNQVFGYLRGNNNKDGYFFIDMNGKQTQIENELLIDDGHPTVFNERYIVTDSYPDWKCKSKLMLIDTKDNVVTVLGKFYSGKQYQNDKRCDLHPRFDFELKSVTIDSVCNGKRNIYHLDLSKII